MKGQRKFDLSVNAHDMVSPPPRERGQLWYDFQIADQFFGGLPNITDKLRWVRSHLPRSSRVKIGYDSAWYEQDILAYRDSLQKVSA